MEFNAEIQRKRELCNQITNYGDKHNSFKEFNKKMLDKIKIRTSDVFCAPAEKNQLDELAY